MTTVGWRGVAVGLEGPDDIVAQVRAQLPDFYAEASPSAALPARLAAADGRLELTLPDGLSLSGPLGPEGFRAAASRIELYLVSHFDDVAPVHAGVVAFDGRAIVLPGTSMAGKSTLVRALLDAGGTYLSDEFALLTPDGCVASYPRRMTIRGDGGSTRVAASLAADVDDPPLPVAVLAALRWRGGATRIDEMSGADAVMALVANSVTVRRSPDTAMTAFAATVAGARLLTGERGDAVETAEILRALAT